MVTWHMFTRESDGTVADGVFDVCDCVLGDLMKVVGCCSMILK